MITDEIMEAIDMMIDMCSSKYQAAEMSSVREMLGDFDEYQWLSMSETDRKDWIEQYLSCHRKKGV